MKTRPRNLVQLLLTLVFLWSAMPQAEAVSFINTGPMHDARVYNTTTLLPDGKVFVAGGISNSVVLASTESYDPATGTWATNAPMPINSIYFAAALLTNGLVLVAGGESNAFTGSILSGAILSNAELYNPTTGTWTPTGSMHEPRINPVAVSLPNGKVLVTGGGFDQDFDGYNYSPTAELYDPASGTWTPTGTMNTKRQSYTLTLLPNGKVLAVGGNFTGHPGGDGPYTFLADFTSAELYDPASGTWTLTGSLAVGRRQHTATLLTNGKVLVTGGTSTNFVTQVAGAELYDPVSGTWSATGSLAVPRSGHAATLLPNGTVLITGGYSNTTYAVTFASAEIYDPVGGTWSATGSLHTARADHAAVLLPNGKVLVAGGGVTNAEIYDSSLPATVILGGLSQFYDGTAKNATATTIPAGLPVTFTYNGSYAAPTNPGNYTVIGTVGSFNYSGSATNTLFIDKPTLTIFWPGDFFFAQAYDGTARSVEAHAAFSFNPNNTYAVSLTYDGLPDAPTNAGVHIVNAATHYNSNVFYDANASRTLTILYSAGDFMFTNTSPVNIGRQLHTATLLTNGLVLIAGGYDRDYNLLASAELYDSDAGTWTPTGDLNVSREGHTATLLPNGKLLVVGGEHNGFFLSSVELYDPADGTWTMTGSMTTPRYGHTATLLANGKVLVAGGQDNVGPLFSAELFDPENETWTNAGSLPTNTINLEQTATLLPNNKVLVTGGYDADYNSSTNAALFNPETGTWTPTGAMNVSRRRHTATVLPDGKVLVAGGNGLGGLYNAFYSAESYDPATGTWSDTGPMNHLHVGHTATLLPGGLVLVAGGGGDGYDPSASAEVYYPALGIWSDVGDLTTNRAYHTATLLTNGQVLIVGGIGTNYQALATAELNDSAAWTVPSATTPITLTSAAIAPGGPFQFGFTNTLGAAFTVLTATNLSLPTTDWAPVAGIREISPGRFHFADPLPANGKRLFYQIRSP